jgi:crossover junction endodeoxyribonuclease RuvC
MGVDPGSRVTGYGVISQEGNHLNCVDFGAIRLAVGRHIPHISSRLMTIHSRLLELIEKYQPSVIAVEGVFHAVNVRSALTLGHVRGIVLLAAEQSGARVAEYSPMEVKRAVTGYGRADKCQIQAMVKTLLKLTELPRPHDAADALAIAICQAFNGSAPQGKQSEWKGRNVPRTWRKIPG